MADIDRRRRDGERDYERERADAEQVDLCWAYRGGISGCMAACMR